MGWLRTRGLAALCLTVALLGRTAQAQAPAPAPGTPAAAAQKTLLALKQGRLEDFTASMHPEALESFRAMLLPVVEGAAKEGKQAEVLPLFVGAADVEALKKLGPSEFYVAFLRGTLEKMEVLSTLAGANHRMLGHVMEGPVAHVVYRMSMRLDQRDIVLPSVISLKKNGAEWAALLTGEVEGMAQILKQRLDNPGQIPDLSSAKVQPEILGHVPDGKQSAYVVVRWITTLGSARTTKTSAHQLQPKDAGWKLLIKGDRAALQQHFEKNYAPL